MSPLSVPAGVHMRRTYHIDGDDDENEKEEEERETKQSTPTLHAVARSDQKIISKLVSVPRTNKTIL